MIVMPSQYALKFPATRPGQDVQRRAALARRRHDFPARARDSVDVNTFTSSGMIAPASVPHVMTVDSFHHSVPSPRSGMSSFDTM